MVRLTKEALLVHNALSVSGLENPINNKHIDKNICKYYIKKYMMKIMKLLNLDLEDDSIIRTPHRIARMYVEEIFSGLDYSNFPKITVFRNKMQIDENITVRDITLTSICEHHFIVFDGKAFISYIPRKNIIGLSKINRIVQFFAHRPQIQERLTKQILLALQTLLNTNDVAVSINAVHFCVKARGVSDVNSNTITTSLGGVFRSNPNIRQDFLNVID